MDTVQQRAFKSIYKQAKRLVVESKKDHVIINIPDAITSKKFRIFLADQFFDRRIKYERIVCYLSHP